MGAIDVLDLHWPLAGQNRQMGFQNQAPYSTPELLNVRNQDVFQQRLRGGSRPGLVQVLPPKTFEIDDPPGSDTFGPIDITVSKDSYMAGHSSLDQNNYGSNSSCLIGNNSAVDNPLRTIMHFDLTTAIASGSTITSASLSFYVGGSGVTSAIAAKVYRVIQTAWVENQVSWLVYSTGNAWGTIGCALDGTDYSTTTPTPVDWNFQVGGGWNTITGMAAFVQDAVTSRSRQCHLLLRVADDSFATIGSNYSNVRSLQYADSTYHPKLTVEGTT